MKKRLLAMASALVVVVCLAVSGAMAAPILDAGWASDQIDGSYIPSEFSPYVYALSGPAQFSITDYWIPGDTYYVWDFTTLVLTTSFYSGTPFPPSDASGDAGWADAAFSKGSVLLAAGAHELTVTGDGVAGIPAGFFARIDSVPEPGTMLLLGTGLMGLAALPRRKQI